MSLENKYFAELARRLRAAGITAGHPEKNRLTVLLNNQPVLSVSAGSDVFLLPAGSNQPEAGELYHKVAQTADEVYAYVEAVQTAPLLHASGLSEKFHLLADFGGAVLAGRELENGWGYQFVTWIWDHDRTGVSHGHYYEEDFQGAKQDFAVRSGLISKAQLFSPEELTQLYWCDHGWWEFDLDRYSASLSATMRITPDNKNPTAGSRSMKSGYGVNQLVTTDVSSTQSSATTPAQNAVSYFSEFNYEMFWRLLEQMGGGYNTRFEFQKNEYSTYRGRTHFTPIWYPNGSYTVNTWLIDCWTPAGMLSMNLSDSLTIRGSLWDDWHIAPLEP